MLPSAIQNALAPDVPLCLPATRRKSLYIKRLGFPLLHPKVDQPAWPPLTTDGGGTVARSRLTRPSHAMQQFTGRDGRPALTDLSVFENSLARSDSLV